MHEHGLRLVLNLYREVGLSTTFNRDQRCGYNPDLKQVRLIKDEMRAMHLHDLAHALIAPKEALERYEFGLGFAPHVGPDIDAISCLIDRDDAKTREENRHYYDNAEDVSCIVHTALVAVHIGYVEACEVSSYISIDLSPTVDLVVDDALAAAETFSEWVDLERLRRLFKRAS